SVARAYCDLGSCDVHEGYAVPREGVGMAPPTLAQVLIERRDQILARFVAEVRREDLAPAGLSQSLLIDHIPTFLDEIVEELRQTQRVRSSFDAADRSVTARRHGGQRWSLGYD